MAAFNVDSTALITGLTSAAITIGGSFVKVASMVLTYLRDRDKGEKENIEGYIEKMKLASKQCEEERKEAYKQIIDIKDKYIDSLKEAFEKLANHLETKK